MSTTTASVYEPLSDYDRVSARIRALESNWQLEIDETIRRREVRNVHVSVTRWRAEKKLKPHETYIPRRVVDCNIRREQPAYFNYITQSWDTAKFRPVRTKLNYPLDELEHEFTGFCQYPGWQLPLFATVDGAETHGWDAVEVIFDDTQPGHFRLRHMGHENLLFQQDVTDIQKSPDLSIIYPISTIELQQYVNEYDFNADAVEDVMEWLKANENQIESSVNVHKYFYKEFVEDEAGGHIVVMVGWWCEKAKNWLKTPAPLELGRETATGPMTESEYPVYLKRYLVSENEVITQSIGRVFLDEHDQEACTQLVTAYVNRAIIATWILANKRNPSDDTKVKQLEISLENGRILDAPVDFFNIDPPDPGLLQALMTITNQNANETGQVDFAVNNRRDSRKTATEIQTATQQAAMLNSVQVALTSIWLRDLWNRCWQIVQNRVQNGLLQSTISQWELFYQVEYVLLPAGDVDVIRRAQILQAMKEDWPVVQNTGAADVFLEDIFRHSAYAENAPKYIDAMKSGVEKQRLIEGMKTALQTITADQQVGTVVQQKYGQQLMQLVEQYQKVMTPPGEKPAPIGAPQPLAPNRKPPNPSVTPPAPAESPEPVENSPEPVVA